MGGGRPFSDQAPQAFVCGRLPGTGVRRRTVDRDSVAERRTMMQFLMEHRWLTVLLFAVLIFILNLARRFAVARRRIPREKRLELIMRRAAKGMRRLARAQRLLDRFIAVRDAAPGRPIPDKLERLRRVVRDTVEAEADLSAVFKKAPALGCSRDAMQNIERSIGAAKTLRGECRRQAGVRTHEGVAPAGLTDAQVGSVVRGCARALEQASIRVETWVRETERARAEMARDFDPVVFNSGGILRNPLRPETAIEDEQTVTVLELRRTEIDIGRVSDCLSAVTGVLSALEVAGERDAHELQASAGRALDTIDVALGDAELSLPEDLASGVSPYQPRDGSVQPGSLERIYVLLSQVEASFAGA